MLKKLLNLLADVAVYGASTALGQVINFLLLPLYTKHLTTRDYGVLLMLGILSMVFAPLANLGMSNAIFRRFKLERDPDARAQVLATGLTSVLISSTVLCLGCWLGAQSIADGLVEDPSTVGLVRLTALGAALSTIGSVPSAALRAARQVKTTATLNLIRLLGSILLTIWLVAFRELGVAGVVWGSLAADALILPLQLLLTRRSFAARPSWEKWRLMARYGLPFVPGHLQGVALTLFGQFWVNRNLGLDEAGLMNVATRLTLPLTFAVNSVQNAWVAYKFEVHAEEENPADFFRSILTYYACVMTYLWVGIAFWGPEVLRWMTPEQYHAATGLIAALALVPLCQGFYFMFATGLELTEKTLMYPVVSFCGLVAVVANSLWMVPAYGPNGAAIALVLGWLLMAGVMNHFARQHFRIDYDWPRLAALVVLTVALGIVATADQGLPAAARLAIAVAASLAFPLIELAILASSTPERRRLGSLLGRLRRRAGMGAQPEPKLE